MMRRFFGILAVLVMVSALTGCGEKPAETKAEVTEAVTEKNEETMAKETEAGTRAAAVAAEAIKNMFETAAAEETAEAGTAAETEEGKNVTETIAYDPAQEGEGISDIKDTETGINLRTHNGATVLHHDTVMEKKDEYSIEGTIVELMTDRAIDRGWSYYYIDSLEDGAEILTWYPADGKFTSLAMVMECVNLSEKPRRYGDVVKAKIVFDEGGENKEYEGVPFQSNPGQIDAWGYENTRASVFSDVEKDEFSLVGFIFDVDKEFHDAMVEEDIKEPTWVYIDFVDGDRYCLNIRTEAIIFGYDDSDDESVIINDIHRTMKEATGTEFFEEFLTQSPDFMNIVEKSGIDVKEAARRYSSRFSIKVFDVIFESETEATVSCMVTAPDFIEMYKILEKKTDEAFSGVDKTKLTEKEFYEKMGQLLMDYLNDPHLPEMDHHFDAKYTYSSGAEAWYPDDRELLLGDMRVPLLNF